MKGVLTGTAIVSLALATVPADAIAGPWTLPEGYLVTSYTYIQTDFDQFFDLDKNKLDLPGPIEQRDQLLSLTYGFWDEWEAALRLSYFMSDQRFPGNEVTASGMGDTWLSIKHLVYSDMLDVALQARVKWPGPYDADVVASPGDGQDDLEFRILAGRFWDRAYVDLEVGYRFRAGVVPNEYEVFLDTGYSLTQWLRGRAFGILINAEDGTGSVNDPGVDLRATEEDVLSVGGSLTVDPADGWTVTLGVTTVLAGRNTALRTDVGLTVAYTFDVLLP